MKVQAYRNLSKGGYSVMSLDSAHGYGKVVAHADEVVIFNPRFVVQPAGNRRARKEGVRNVHAFVRGSWEPDAAVPAGPFYRASYNPFLNRSFVDRTGKALYTGRVAVLSPSGCYYEED